MLLVVHAITSDLVAEYACETLFPELTVEQSNECAEGVEDRKDWRVGN